MANKDSYIPASDLWEMINTGLRKTNSGTDKGTLGKNGASRVIKKDNVASDSFGLYTQRIANGNNNTISDISLLLPIWSLNGMRNSLQKKTVPEIGQVKA